MQAPLSFPPGRDDRPATPALLGERGYALRPLHDGDLPWLRDLYASTRAEELAPLSWSDAAKRTFLDSQFALQHRHYLSCYADADFLAIERDGAPAGRYYLRRAAPDHLIIDICLLPGERGHGVATTLLTQSRQQAITQGCGLQLHVRFDNDGALRLYRRLGFVVVEDQGAHLLMRCARG